MKSSTLYLVLAAEWIVVSLACIPNWHRPGVIPWIAACVLTVSFYDLLRYMHTLRVVVLLSWLVGDIFVICRYGSLGGAWLATSIATSVSVMLCGLRDGTARAITRRTGEIEAEIS